MILEIRPAGMIGKQKLLWADPSARTEAMALLNFRIFCDAFGLQLPPTVTYQAIKEGSK